MNSTDLINLARKHGLKLKNDIRLNEMGLDFLVAFAEDEAGQKWVLRVPRRQDMLQKIEAEAKILRFATARLNVAVPDWQIATSELIAYPLLPWPTILSFDAKTYEVSWYIDKDAPLIAPSLAEALVQMHAVSAEDVRAAGLKVSTPDQYRVQFQNDLHHVKSELGMSPDLEVRSRAWIDNDTLCPDVSAFIHGDLYAGHILADEQGQVRGMIDWSEAEMSDPSIDFTGHYNVFGLEGLDQLLHEYEKRGGYVWPQMEDHILQRAALATPIRYALFALESRNEDFLAAAKAQLGM